MVVLGGLKGSMLGASNRVRQMPSWPRVRMGARTSEQAYKDHRQKKDEGRVD